MSGAYIPKKGRYDTVLSVLREQIDEYFKVDSDLNRITEITAWQSEDGINLSASVTRTLTRRRSQLFNGIYRNCQLIVMGEGEPVKEEEENE